MKKIEEYKIIYGASAEILSSFVMESIKDGFQPYKAPFNTIAGYFQAVVKYETSENYRETLHD